MMIDLNNNSYPAMHLLKKAGKGRRPRGTEAEGKVREQGRPEGQKIGILVYKYIYLI